MGTWELFLSTFVTTLCLEFPLLMLFRWYVGRKARKRRAANQAIVDALGEGTSDSRGVSYADYEHAEGSAAG